MTRLTNPEAAADKPNHQTDLERRLRANSSVSDQVSSGLEGAGGGGAGQGWGVLARLAGV
jgi:hypothetical protein